MFALLRERRRTVGRKGAGPLPAISHMIQCTRINVLQSCDDAEAPEPVGGLLRKCTVKQNPGNNTDRHRVHVQLVRYESHRPSDSPELMESPASYPIMTMHARHISRRIAASHLGDSSAVVPARWSIWEEKCEFTCVHLERVHFDVYATCIKGCAGK